MEVWGTIPDRIMVGVNLIIIIILVLHWRVFNKQATELQKTVSRMDDAEKRMATSDTATRISREQELRAYVHIEKTEVIRNDDLNRLVFQRSEPNPPNGIHYLITFQNMGKTPAYKVTCILDTRVRPIDLPSGEILPMPDIESSGAVGLISKKSLGPNERAVKRVFVARKITDEGLDALASKDAAIYIYGTISYKDAFGNDWSTNFRFMHLIFVQEERFGDQLAVCFEGNDVT